MSTKLGFSARFLALACISLASGDHARAGGVVVAAPAPISLTASDGACPGAPTTTCGAPASNCTPAACTDGVCASPKLMP